jgi:hypothetical protein
MDGTAQILAIEEIRTLKAQYFRFMDTKDWRSWGEVFTPDAVMDVAGERDAARQLGFPVDESSTWVWQGREVIVSGVSAALASVTTVHHGHMGEIVIDSPATAHGIWAMEDVLRYSRGAPVAGFHGYGHYHETYSRDDGRWRIRSMKLTRLLIVPVPW